MLPPSHETQPRQASAPRPPQRTRPQQRLLDKHRAYLRSRETLETSSILRGLLFLAVAVMLFSIARAGLHRVFVPGWWHH